MAFLLSGERPLAAAPSTSPVARAAKRLGSVFAATFSAVRASRRGRLSLITLDAMSAARLRDLGLTHEDVHAAARAPEALAGRALSAARARNGAR